MGGSYGKPTYNVALATQPAKCLEGPWLPQESFFPNTSDAATDSTTQGVLFPRQSPGGLAQRSMSSEPNPFPSPSVEALPIPLRQYSFVRTSYQSVPPPPG